MPAGQRRCALRVTSSYRTVVERAVFVIEGMVPIDLLALERNEVNYLVIQFLSGHSYFKFYQFRVGRATSPLCGYGCRDERNSAGYALFACERWVGARDVLRQDVPFTTDNIVEVMLRSMNDWRAVARYTRPLLLEKKDEESQWNTSAPS
ncbi:uncharacterized protein LOC143259441 [Megalopta genalis]|uniref:uncharacterized protein LOC143259441 n=1 Tax=Megalopta genalis TaxID=115081 RepID=UPI003FD198F3